jgi:hypothetical protein
LDMDSLRRWIQAQENSTGEILRFSAVVTGTLLLIALGVAVGQTLLGSPAPPEAWGLITFLTLLTITLAVTGLRIPRRSKDRVSLAPLQTAIWQGKLAEALGENANALAQAATDWEQMEALLPGTALEPDFTASLREAANARMRRMVELTVEVPGRFGLTLDQAKSQIAEDGRWLHEVRRLVEKSREGAIESSEDGTLRHLEGLVQAREEAMLELRA